VALSLSSAAILEKNKLQASGAWLLLAKVIFPDPNSTTLRFCRNTESIVWPTSGTTYTWHAFPFDIDDTKEEGMGEQTVANIRIGNANRTMQAYMEMDGAKGGVGSEVTLYVVHSDHLGLTSAEIEESFICTTSYADTQWATFGLSARNQSSVMHPPNRYIKNFCRWSFRGNKCGYSGSTPGTVCSKTIDDCRKYGNIRYFGAFPGIPEGGVYLKGLK